MKGVAPYAPANGITADPANGICPWQSSGLMQLAGSGPDEQTAVDDLWHAGVNGRGAYFSATDPVSLGNSISATPAQVAALVVPMRRVGEQSCSDACRQLRVHCRLHDKSTG